MKIYKEMNNFTELYEMCWSGAIDTLKTIIENNKEDEFMELLEEIFIEASETEINDFIWFETDYIYECLEIMED